MSALGHDKYKHLYICLGANNFLWDMNVHTYITMGSGGNTTSKDNFCQSSIAITIPSPKPKIWLTELMRSQ